MALDLAGRGFRPADRLHREQVAIAPVHERLRIDVLVVLGEVEPAAQTLVHHPAVVPARQAELGLDGGAEQRPAKLVEPLALDHDPRGRTAKGLQVGYRNPHILEAQCLERLEAEHVADHRGGQVGDRAFLEQRQVVGHPGEVLARRIGHRLDLVGLGAVDVGCGQPIGPDHGPGGGRGFARDCRRRLDRIDALLRRDPEQADDVGFLRLVVRLPVAHPGVLHDAGLVALLRILDRLYFVGAHLFSLSRVKDLSSILL